MQFSGLIPGEIPPPPPTAAEKAAYLAHLAVEHGMTTMDIARHTGWHKHTVTRLAKAFDIVLPTHREACRRAALKPALMARRVAAMKAANTRKRMARTRRADRVPDWVPADLAEDYDYRLKLYGPAVADRDLRAMVAEAQA